MSYSVSASITPAAAARLIISGGIDLTVFWTPKATEKVFDELLNIPIEEILQIIDHNKYGSVADVKYIPQFGKSETLIRVPQYFGQTGCSLADYAQMGFFLKQDTNAKLDANIKFGENHGKGAALLGIVNCVDKRIVPSSLSNEFCLLDSSTQRAVITRLFFRIPIVQIILKAAKDTQCNGFSSMSQLKESTRHRRSQCLRAIFKQLDAIPSDSLNKRLENIIWEDL